MTARSRAGQAWNLKAGAIRVVTNSERQTMGCLRKWGHAYKERLIPAGDSPAPLRMGGLWHDVMAAWYRSACTMSADHLHAAVIQPWWERRVDYLERAGRTDPEGLQDAREMAELAHGMATGYVQRYAQEDVERWEVLHVEAQVARFLLRPDGRPMRDVTHVDGRRTFRRWAFGGAMDLMLRLRSTGHIYIMEHKSSSAHDVVEDAHSFVVHPHQVRGYAWACAQPAALEGNAITEPVQVRGCIYSLARKVVPRAPEAVKGDPVDVSRGRGWYEVDPETGKNVVKRLSIKSIDTTRDAYLQEVQRRGLNPDAYADQLEKLHGKVFFHRAPADFTAEDMADIEREVTHGAQSIRDAERAAYLPRTHICRAPGAPPCAYEDVCNRDTQMVRAGYRTKTVLHAELSGVMAMAAPMRDNPRLPVVREPTPEEVADMRGEIERMGTPPLDDSDIPF